MCVEDGLSREDLELEKAIVEAEEEALAYRKVVEENETDDLADDLEIKDIKGIYIKNLEIKRVERDVIRVNNVSVFNPKSLMILIKSLYEDNGVKLFIEEIDNHLSALTYKGFILVNELDLNAVDFTRDVQAIGEILQMIFTEIAKKILIINEFMKKELANVEIPLADIEEEE